MNLYILLCPVVDVKIKAIDNELRAFKEQLKKATGSTAVHIKKRAMDTLKRKVNYFNHLKYLYGFMYLFILILKYFID